jgi:hypothetical protein
MKKQKTVKPKPDQARATLRLDREIWTAARKQAIDQGVPFGRLVEDALRAYLKGGKQS